MMHMTADSFSIINLDIVFRNFYYPMFHNATQADLTNADFACGPATLPGGQDTSTHGVERTQILPLVEISMQSIR